MAKVQTKLQTFHTHKLIKSIIERKNNVLSVDILREAHQHKSIFYYFHLILHEQLIIDT